MIVFWHRVQCAAATNGCDTVLFWRDNNNKLDEETLLANGWRLDHGRWICRDHPKTDTPPLKE